MKYDRTLSLFALQVVRDVIWLIMGMVLALSPRWWWITLGAGAVGTAALGVWRDRILTEEAQARERAWWQIR